MPSLQRVPAHHSLLALHHVPLKFDEAAIQEVLDCVTPSNVRIMWSSKEFQVSTCIIECMIVQRHTLVEFFHTLVLSKVVQMCTSE